MGKNRTYELSDALAKRKNSSLGHDHHIVNGSSASMDFIFGSITTVDPPSVVVMNCAKGSTPETNFVWSHFHPFGATYLPFSGRICYASHKVVCSEPGTPRWTSANLQYYEFFEKINETNPMADHARDLAGMAAGECEYPNVFGVTNFDIAYGAGAPNFKDWPETAHAQTSAVGIGPWGIFPTMAMHATRFVTTQVHVDASATLLV